MLVGATLVEKGGAVVVGPLKLRAEPGSSYTPNVVALSKQPHGCRRCAGSQRRNGRGSKRSVSIRYARWDA